MTIYMVVYIKKTVNRKTGREEFRRLYAPYVHLKSAVNKARYYKVHEIFKICADLSQATKLITNDEVWSRQVVNNDPGKKD